MASTPHEYEVERQALLEVLNEMREFGTGPTLFYAQRIAAAMHEPDVITKEVIESGRLSERMS